MPYVRRDSSGVILAVSINADPGFEYIEEDAAELVAFEDRLGVGRARSRLQQSDLDVIRVLEDLIYLLMEQNVIRFTDLPENAQRKLNDRRSLRQCNNSLSLLGEDFKIV